MNINKKYAIRKLAVGVASISIGLFVINSVDNQFGSNISLLKNNSGVVHAACNWNGNKYFLNHYDEYETVYEADGTLAKGEHKVYKQGGESTQLFAITKTNCSWDEPYSAFGDNEEMFHKPYEVIINNRDKGKEVEDIELEIHKKREQAESDRNVTTEESQEISNKEQELSNKIAEYHKKLVEDKFFVETRTHKKIELNSDENITEPIYKEDGTVVIPSHTISKKYKNWKDEFNNYTIYKLDKDYFDKDDEYFSAESKKNSDEYRLYEESVIKNPKIIKVGNVERLPISTTAIETDYVANNTLDYGVRNTTNQGKEGLRESVVTYEVDRNTGNLKNPTTVENTIPMEKKIVEVGTKEKVVYSKKGNDVIKTTTTYELNTTTGKVTPKSTETIHNAGGVKDKVVYSKDGDNIVKDTTTYEVNPDNGNITENTTRGTFKENGAKDKVVVEKIVSPVRYEKDNTREKGQENITVQGKDGSKTTTITYTVNPKTGEVEAHPQEPVIVEPTTTIIKVALKDKVVYSKDGDNIVKDTTTYEVNPDNGSITENTTRETFKENGAKDKVVVEKLQSQIRYEKDAFRDKGKENITVQGKDGSKTTTITYTVNPKTGEIEVHPQEPVIVEPTETVIKVAAKDEIIYSIGNYIEKEDYEEGKYNVYKKTIVYEVNPKTGEITENRKVELYKENVMKPKIIKEERIPSPIRYEKDSSRDKGQENITNQGKDGSKITKTVYSLDVNTGEILSYTPKPEITEPTTTIIKVAAKDKVEIVNKDDGSVVKEITSYTVNEKTGEITESKREEVIKTKTETSKGDELSPVVDKKDFVGGVNPNDAPVVEELPELKVAVIKDKENNVLEVIKENEKPKDIQGYKNTGKTEIDKDGYKVYIYEKVEDKQDSIVDIETNEPTIKEKSINEENKDNNKEIISKKEELPKTSVSMLSTVGLLSIFGLRKNKKKDK